MSRMDAINSEIKGKESGFGPDRAWYINNDKLDELGIKQFKVKEGDSFVRILPPEDPESYFGLRIFVHYNLGPNQNDAFLCPRMMKNERCVICERQDALKAKEVDEKVWKALGCFPPRYLFLIRDCANADTIEEGTQVYDAPQTINSEILTLSKDRRSGEVLDVSDPDKGKLVVFTRKGMKAMNTKYSGFELENDDPIPDEWMDNLPILEDCLHYGTEEDMLKALGLGAEDSAPAEESAPKEETSSRSGRRDRRSRDTSTKSEETPKEEAPAKEEAPKETEEKEEQPAGRRERRAPRGEDKPKDEAPAKEEASDTDDVKSRLRERLNSRKK